MTAWNSDIGGRARAGDPTDWQPLDDHREERAAEPIFRLSDMAAVARRQYRWIAVIVAAALLAGVVATLLMKPIYTAAASVQLEQETAKIIEGQDVEPLAALSDSARYLQTQVDILNSRSMTMRVADSLRLADNDDFLTAMGEAPTNAAVAGADRPAERRQRVLAVLQKHFKASIPINSRIALIMFSAPDRTLAARVANGYAESYITGNISRRADANRYAQQFLKGELARAERRLEESERAAIDYARGAQLVDARDSGGDADKASSGRSLTTASLVQMNGDLATARAARIAAQQHWAQASGTPAMQLPEVIDNATIQQLGADRARQLAAYQQLRKRYKADYPDVIQAQAQLTSADAQIARLAGEIRASIRGRYDLAARQERALSQAFSGLETDTLSEQQRRVRLDILSRQATTNHALYDALLQRYKEVSAASGIATNNISFLDHAEPPNAANSPRPLVNMAIALLAGLGLALLVIFLRETFDDSVRSPDDVPGKLQLPLLGVTPRITGGESAIEALADKHSPLSEAYYSVRAALEFSSGHGVPASLLVTSSGPSEGKSTTAFALALDFAEVGVRTLLVDADLRAPSLHKHLGVTNELGFVNVLTGQVASADAVQRVRGTKLDFLPSGPIPSNPVQLLAGNAVRHFLRDHQQAYDLILIDGSPILGLADAPQLAQVVGGTVVVVEAHRKHRGQTKSAIRRLRKAGVPLLGVVLTKLDQRQVGYDYSYDFDYGKRER
jgi:succinoglycan biosynthesis transport protein ExoP